MRKLGGIVIGLVGVAAACSASGTRVFGDGAPGTGASPTASASSSSAASSTSGGQGGGPVLLDGGLTGVGSGGEGCVDPGPDEDWDKDGWTIAQGDCNDCDPNVNPGALDTVTVGEDGGVVLGDEDCDGVPGEVPQPCDDGLAIDDPDPVDAARAVELCTPLTDPKKWGLKSARWTLPDGSDPSTLQPVDPTVPMSTLLADYALGYGVVAAFGPQVHVQAGERMLALSSGTARAPSDPGFQDVHGFDKKYTAASPMGFPKESPACPGITTGVPHDAVALEVVVVAPTNAHGLAYNFDFLTYEWPQYTCSSFNDFFVALLYPIPEGQQDGNVSFDAKGNPVSVNNAFLQVCGCKSGPPCVEGGKTFPCALGDLGLVGTGFGPDTGGADHGATGWLETKAPVTPHEEITLRWAVYDSSDGIYDTTTLVDGFRWILDTGAPAVGTSTVPTPK